MADDETRMIVLGRVILGVAPASDSSLTKAGCGHKAWISDNAARMVAEGNTQTICDACIPMEQMLGKVVGEVPGAMQSAADHLGIPVTEIEDLMDRMLALHGGRRATPEEEN